MDETRETHATATKIEKPSTQWYALSCSSAKPISTAMETQAQHINSFNMKSSSAPISKVQNGVLPGGSLWFVPKTSVLDSSEFREIPFSKVTSNDSRSPFIPFKHSSIVSHLGQCQYSGRYSDARWSGNHWIITTGWIAELALMGFSINVHSLSATNSNRSNHYINQ